MTVTETVGPTEGDAYGLTLARSWRTGAKPGEHFEIIERDDGFLSITDAAGYFVGRDEWPEMDRWAFDQVEGRVLDIGCGGGRHAVELVKHGFEVVGIDLSENAVQVTCARGVPAHVASIHEPHPELGQFDTALLLGNNIGLLGDWKLAAAVLANVTELVRPGGQIIGVGMDPFISAGKEHLAYHERNRQLGRMPGQARIRYRDRQIASPWLDQLFVTTDQLEELLTGTDWHIEEVWRDGADYAVRLRRSM